MARTLSKLDAVIVGFGWTGSIAAKGLVDAGLGVVALERGPGYDRQGFVTRVMHDGLRYAAHSPIRSTARH